MNQKEIAEKFEKRHRTLIAVLTECPEIVFVGTNNLILRTKTEAVSLVVGVETATKLKDVLARYRKRECFSKIK